MLFKGEFPVLGPATSIQELSGVGSGLPVLNAYKPITREIVNQSINVLSNTTGNLTGFLWRAPWQAAIIQIGFIAEVKASVSTTLQIYKVPYASQPEAISSGATLLAAALNIDTGIVNDTWIFPALTATAASLQFGAGDLLGFVLSTSPTSLAGGLLQVELQQIG